ncbi:alpha-amylase family glycosyl hydrolase [uncultured Algibacter sp.]|uniref:alpha-amylase family glycosyl hydrolase n=1 Tax=uncultured Algibacter sp. TaxID=298659 RepID=UPI00261FDB2C|nr:alpha-amylase family glycosyl hydrolase [uncultured Algibacter sp.]
MKYVLVLLICMVFFNCENKKENSIEKSKVPFVWEGANIYFLLTDRFNNGDASNDVNFERNNKTGKLRGFKGGDIKGVAQKIKEGYFTYLGINAIWMTPIVEQNHGGTDEGTGLTYGFHGYWTRDWTAIDPNFGTKEDLAELVEIAHKHGIRILLDAVINHTGPVTPKDTAWPNEWVRTTPQCDYKTYENTITCTLVKNLPDIKTESNDVVELPEQLINKWKSEGRYKQEIVELDAFFKRTRHPRAPRFYIMKWLTDYITEFGIDGYRVDTVKHVEENVWQEFKKECDFAFTEFKKSNPEKVLDDNNFYLVGEVYNYGISASKAFDFGDKKVNYFDNAFNGLINFEMKWNAAQLQTEELFAKYSYILNSDLKGYGVLNYLSSHDDGQPFDAKREKSFETATKLLLCPGTSQVYYGDESARSLVIENTVGDATLRSFMNWSDIQNEEKTQSILRHWQKLGRFRASHPAIGAGSHKLVSNIPYVFVRRYSKDNFKDEVLVGLNLPAGVKTIDVSQVFKNGDQIRDAYSDVNTTVEKGTATIDSPYNILLLETF